MELDGQSAITEVMPSWDMTYKSGQLVSNDADIYTDTPITLRSITSKQDTFVQMCLRELGLGYDGEEKIVDLSLLTSDYVAQDGDVLTGTLKSEVMISVADGATITLQDCSIQKKHISIPASSVRARLKSSLLRLLFWAEYQAIPPSMCQREVPSPLVVSVTFMCMAAIVIIATSVAVLPSVAVVPRAIRTAATSLSRAER